MKALLDLFKQTTQSEEFDAIKIALASPDLPSNKRTCVLFAAKFSNLVCSWSSG